MWETLRVEKEVGMKRSELGFWGTADQALQWAGKVSAWFLTGKLSPGEESATYSMIGGAVLGAVFGAVAGFALSYHSPRIDIIELAIIGGLLGICTGFPFGAFVDSVDDTIKNVLRSLNSK